jgi:uncharacterized protein
MKRTYLPLAAIAALLTGTAGSASQAADVGEPAAATTPAATSQWIYVLRLVPRLHDDAAWTPADNATIGRHFQRLKTAAAARKVILAGRTTEPGDRTFGIVIFEAADEGEARRFMDADPAVADGLMTATLHPYAVALQRQP